MESAMTHGIRILSALIAAMALAVAAGPGQAANDRGSVQGVVTDASGQPISAGQRKIPSQ